MTKLPLGRGGTRTGRSRSAAVVGAIAVLHVGGWTMYLCQAHNFVAGGGFAGAGLLAYVLGMRHAFDADHIAAIDDTTRLLMTRGTRPHGVGFFFALGHSSVVLILALVTALAADRLSDHSLDRARAVGGDISVFVAIAFLLLVASLNLAVLRGLVRLWHRHRQGRLQRADLDLLLLNRGLMNRVLGPRVRSLIRASWHMAPVGFLFGLGLETASEVTVLTMSASGAGGGHPRILAVMSLPLLFAAGMTVLDTVDSFVMSRAYSWAHEEPERRLYYNLATTGITVAVGLFVASVYLAGAIEKRAGLPWLAGYGALADHFELLGLAVGAILLVSWMFATVLWKLHYGRRDSAA